jgi:hypothetical protein
LKEQLTAHIQPSEVLPGIKGDDPTPDGSPLHADKGKEERKVEDGWGLGSCAIFWPREIGPRRRRRTRSYGRRGDGGVRRVQRSYHYTPH